MLPHMHNQLHMRPPLLNLLLNCLAEVPRLEQLRPFLLPPEALDCQCCVNDRIARRVVDDNLTKHLRERDGRLLLTHVPKRKTENRKQKTENREQKTESRADTDDKVRGNHGEDIYTQGMAGQ
eukprot:COSAG06_NODE_3252_length_5612_cov_786.685652_1_plen_123_part_00